MIGHHHGSPTDASVKDQVQNTGINEYRGVFIEQFPCGVVADTSKTPARHTPPFDSLIHLNGRNPVTHDRQKLPRDLPLKLVHVWARFPSVSPLSSMAEPAANTHQPGSLEPPPGGLFKPGSYSFSSSEAFLPQTSQQVQWHSATTVAQEGTGAPCSPPTAGATRRCPVKPSTPLGPDQVNVYYYFFLQLTTHLLNARHRRFVEYWHLLACSH
jgi:hypothetical protein